MIGVGLIAIGIMFMLILNNREKAASASSADLSAVPAEMDFPAPELDLVALNGVPVSLADYRGSVVLVNLWATWCPPCRQEMPTLQAFYDRYKDDGFVLIAIDQEETREVVQPFVEEFDLTFPIWLDIDYLAQREFKTMSLPSSYVVDRNGRVKLMWIGSISKANLELYVPDIILE
ncbi:MAG: TlpA family protein disulfide reductase [Anaerolineales bacterium]|nr:TlpA family protein disulfide reductase [Anaerolineales bacterium]